jgi:hypothetical protein
MSPHPNRQGGRRNAPWLDVVGITASLACLAHCLLLPLAIALLPALSTMLSVPEEAHLVAFGLAVPVSGWAMLRGYHRHGIVHPLIFGLVGLSALGLGSLGGFPWLVETGCTVAGSLLLTTAHLQNWRLKRA